MDPLARVYFLSFAVGALFALVSWLLSHGHHGHHHGHGNAHGLARVLTPIANLTSLAALACVGGGVGYIALAAGAGRASSVVLAASSGLIAAYAIGSLLAMLDASSHYAEELDHRGLVATVLNRIGANGVGEVEYLSNGKRAVLPARSASGAPIEVGAEVVVVAIDRGIASVTKSSDAFGEEN